MIEVGEMTNDEIAELLRTVGYGHLGCSGDGTPYIVPVHYAYGDSHVYIYTTEGKKTDIIDKNPMVCLQVEDVKSNLGWKSVIVTGRAIKIERAKEREEAVAAIAAANPTLAPAVSIHWIDNWVRENHEVVYRLGTERATGRKSLGTSESLFAPTISNTLRRAKVPRPKSNRIEATSTRGDILQRDGRFDLSPALRLDNRPMAKGRS